MTRHAWLLTILLIGGAARADESISLRVMTFNVWYGGEQVSLTKIGEVIRAADADIVGIQEADGNLQRIAEVAGMPYVDARRRLISRWPIFDSGVGERTQTGASPYSTTGLDLDALHAWVMVAPGKVVAVANVHLSSDPSGLEIVRDGGRLADVLAAEQLRATETKPLTALGKLAEDGTPVFLVGDFNTPSHQDWNDVAKRAGAIPYPVAWPVTKLLESAGLRDSYREIYPDPTTKRGITWTPGTPHPIEPSSKGRERIDMIWVGGRARTVASQVVGETGNPNVDIAVSPWPSDHRAVVSTFRVVPRVAPSMIAVTPRRVKEGGTFLVRTWDNSSDSWSAYIVPRGGVTKDALFGVKDLPGGHQRTIPFSASQLPPANYDAILVGRDGGVLQRNAFTVAGDNRPQIAMVEANVRPGSPIRARWRNSPGDLRDWIGIYAAGETDVMSYLGFAYTEALFDGEVAVDVDPGNAPLPAGDYELRLMHDETYVELARTRFTLQR